MNTFAESGLKPEILKAIDDLGFVNPTPIQEKTIPAILESKHDIIGLAQTGTGKTAGFGLPILQQIDFDEKTVQSIVLCPTRELCLQITKDMQSYGRHMKGFSVVAVYGGANIDEQVRKLRKGAHVVVGTPGRTLDLINRKSLKIDHIRWLVLDEADEMLNMGFRDDMDAILETTPKDKRTLLFSATMPNEVRRIADDYMNKPIEISAGKKNSGADNVLHQYYVVMATDKYLALKRIADINPDIYGIVFCRTREETKEIASKLMNDGYDADALHGDLSQAQRDYVMNKFRKRQLQMLVATDVAARGLDINDLTHVINYNLPDDPEIYIHRSGRTGRAGKEGISIIISHTREGRKIANLERIIGKKFEYKKIPTGKEICERQLYKLMDDIQDIQVDEEQIKPYLNKIYQKFEDMQKDELLKRIVFEEFNRFLLYYNNAPDINVNKDSFEREKRNKSSQNDRLEKKKEVKLGRKGKFSRFFINLGIKNSFKPLNLIALINDNTGTRNIEIGKIEILRNFSFFEVDSDYEELVLESFTGVKYSGTEVMVELAKPAPQEQVYTRLRKEDTYAPKKRVKRDMSKQSSPMRHRKSK